MSRTPVELMKEYVNSQKFSSTNEVMAAMKEMFKDVLQQVMESELENKLGYEKSERIAENRCAQHKNDPYIYWLPPLEYSKRTHEECKPKTD